MLLFEDASVGVVAGVGDESKRTVGEERKSTVVGDGLFGVVEGLEGRVGPSDGLGAVLVDRVQQGDWLGEKWNKPAIEVNHADKTSQLLLRSGQRRVADRGDLVGQRLELAFGHGVTQERYHGLAELTLVDVDVETMFGETFEDATKVGFVGVGVGTGDQYVVDVAELVREAVECAVHLALEHLRGIAEPKSHRREFGKAEGRRDSRRRVVCGVNSDVVEGVSSDRSWRRSYIHADVS